MTRIAADVREAVRPIFRAPQLKYNSRQRACDVVQAAFVFARAHFSVADVRDVDHRADDTRHCSIRRREFAGPEEPVTGHAVAIVKGDFDLLPPPARDTYAHEIMQALAVAGAPRLNLERRASDNVLALQPERLFERAVHRYVTVLPIQ